MKAEATLENIVSVPRPSDLLPEIPTDLGTAAERVLSQSLLAPIQDFVCRPAKNIRAQLVSAGFHFAGERVERTFNCKETELACHRLAEALEAIHAGSLIIDDIQDGSKERRGEPCLHESFGTAIALNVGNWLYFKPFELIRSLNVQEKTELALYRLCHQAMLDAHVGQALDLGTKIDEIEQSEVFDVCISSLKLKTGVLMALALTLGAALGSASDRRLKALREFGLKFGIALQMYDDIGNLNLPAGTPKRHEDLHLRRPTWIWATAASHSSPLEYRGFVEAVRQLPDERALHSWLRATDFVNQARAEAAKFLDRANDELCLEIGDLNSFPQASKIIGAMTERIQNSYA